MMAPPHVVVFAALLLSVCWWHQFFAALCVLLKPYTVTLLIPNEKRRVLKYVCRKVRAATLLPPEPNDFRPNQI